MKLLDKIRVISCPAVILCISRSCITAFALFFDNRTLIIHPASTIFGNFPAPVRKSMQVNETTIRLSVGLENSEDIINDIKQTLK